jgi:hypothetical protein
MYFKSIVVCQICKKIFDFPIALTCGHSICVEHINVQSVRISKQIYCKICSQSIKIDVIKPNLELQKIIEKYLYLNRTEKHLKSSIESDLREFYGIFEGYKSLKTGFELNVYEHLSEIRRQIDLHRENFPFYNFDIEAYILCIEKTEEFERKFNSYMVSKYFEKIDKLGYKRLEDSLKELDLEFKNPNFDVKLLLKMRSIIRNNKEIVKQTNKNLLEILRDFKKLNGFEPIKNSNLFGNLFLTYTWKNPFQSTILDKHLSYDLIRICKLNHTKWKLLYRGSRDGFSSEKFHLKCDNLFPTLTIIKEKHFGNIFGAFTTASWKKPCECEGLQPIEDEKAFLFNLKNKSNIQGKFNIKQHTTKWAIVYSEVAGPCFGDCIQIIDHPNKNEFLCRSQKGYVYDFSILPENIESDFIEGRFEISDIEVFKLSHDLNEENSLSEFTFFWKKDC